MTKVFLEMPRDSRVWRREPMQVSRSSLIAEKTGPPLPFFPLEDWLDSYLRSVSARACGRWWTA